ncbi:MAG: PorT family protein [Proteobacteria bacterium]|nr:PorT family protein [Pseudomonadota bacterium]
MSKNEHDAKHVAFGGKTGLNIATFGGDDADRVGSDGVSINSTYSLGFTVGAFARVVLAKNWGVQVETGFSTRGAGTKVGRDERSPLDYSYVEVSTLARTQWVVRPIYEKLSIHGLLGPSLGYLLSAKRDEQDFTDSAERVDFGLHIGVGASLELPYGNPVIEVRYYYGFADIGGESGLDLKHRAFSILVGYEYGLQF